MKNKNKIVLIVVISLVLALLLSTGGFFTYKYFDLKNSKEDTKTELPNKQEENKQQKESEEGEFKTFKGTVKGNDINIEIKDEDSEGYNGYGKVGKVLIGDFNLNNKSYSLEIKTRLYLDETKSYENYGTYIKLGDQKMTLPESDYIQVAYIAPEWISTYNNYFLIRISNYKYNMYYLYSLEEGYLTSIMNSKIDLSEFSKGKIKYKETGDLIKENNDTILPIKYTTIDLNNGYKLTETIEKTECNEILKNESHELYCACGGQNCQSV